MKLRGADGMPDGLGLGFGGLPQPGQAVLPAGTALFFSRLLRPWAGLAALGCCAGLDWRLRLAAADRPPLDLLLDWLGLLLWFGALWLLPAMEELAARQDLHGLGGLRLKFWQRALSNALLALGASAALALAPLGLLAAYNPRAELLVFRDAENHLFSTGLGLPVLTMLLSGGTAIVAVSLALLMLARCLLSRERAIALWLALSLCLNLGVLSGNGWLATLGINSATRYAQYMVPGLGGQFKAWLAICVGAEEHYVYQNDLLQQLARSVLGSLGIALLALVLALLASTGPRPRGQRARAAPRVTPATLALWAGLLVPLLFGLGRAVWYACNPAASGPALPQEIALAAVLGLAGALWLFTWPDPAAALTRFGGADWLRLLFLPLVWLGLCAPAIATGMASAAQSMWACAAAGALSLAAYALLLLSCAIGKALRRCALEPAGRLGLLACAALLLLPAGLQGAPVASLLRWLDYALASPAQSFLAQAVLAAIAAGAVLLLWLIQRPAAPRAKAPAR